MFVNFFLGIAMSVYVVILMRKLKGLTRLVRPWEAMLGGVVIFLVSKLAIILDSFFPVYFPFSIELLDTVFFGFLVLSMFYFKMSWDIPDE